MTRAGVVGTGPRIEGFRWIRALGSGGFADVHLYHQQVPSRDVAIKIARSNVEGGNEAIRHEADAMARVSSHPTIVNLHGVGALDDGREFLIMEYCPVTNIADQVRAHPMDVPAALDLIIRISSGVEMLHRMGYVHRDIKPGNIMLDSYQSPVLTDFGVSARIGEGRDGGLEGFSVMWAPPEQHDGSAPADPSQDVWALGASLWTLLVGRSPFEDPIGDNSTVAVAAAGLVVAMLTGGGQSVRIDPVDSPSANGDDPADLTVPPTAPSGLNGRLEGESIVWTWTAPPDPNYASEDLAFQYRLDRPGEAPMAASSPVASVTLPAAHGGDNCLTVRTVVSASGLQSQPVSICVAVE